MSAVARGEAVVEGHQALRQHGRTFRAASYLLDAEQADDAAILYGFCRAVDDAVDESDDHEEAREQLSRYRAGLDGEPSTPPICQAMRELAGRRGVPLSAAAQLLDGVASDLSTVCVADDEELLRYAYRVAGTVGLMMCPILGVVDPRAHPFAVDLGIAMQLTNICRDVAEDARRGRVYLPRRRLEEAGTSPEALLAGETSERGGTRVRRALLGLAERYYRSADEGMRYIPARARLAILLASRLYRAQGLVEDWPTYRRRGDRLPPVAKLRCSVVAVGSWLALARRPTAAHDRALHDGLGDLVALGAL